MRFRAKKWKISEKKPKTKLSTEIYMFPKKPKKPLKGTVLL